MKLADITDTNNSQDPTLNCGSHSVRSWDLMPGRTSVLSLTGSDRSATWQKAKALFTCATLVANPMSQATIVRITSYEEHGGSPGEELCTGMHINQLSHFLS
jgi:hypothetical protein